MFVYLEATFHDDGTPLMEPGSTSPEWSRRKKKPNSCPSSRSDRTGVGWQCFFGGERGAFSRVKDMKQFQPYLLLMDWFKGKYYAKTIDFPIKYGVFFVGKCPVWRLLNITHPAPVGDLIYLIAGWCLSRTFANPWFYRKFEREILIPTVDACEILTKKDAWNMLKP